VVYKDMLGVRHKLTSRIAPYQRYDLNHLWRRIIWYSQYDTQQRTLH
jgi:hypothetical protein